MNATMKAMVLHGIQPVESFPLTLEEVPLPRPRQGEVLIQIECCAICRTDLHIVEGDLKAKKSPLIPGHQAVGRVVERGPGADHLPLGQTVGAAWLGSTCGVCPYCLAEKENLCLAPRFTGYDFDGGYAEYMVAKEDFVYPLADPLNDIAVAPLLCAGIIGYRAFKRSQFFPGASLGLFGFGSSAHILLQLALHQNARISVITRAEAHRELARSLGASWVGATSEGLPEKLDSAILFAPAGELVPEALSCLKRGGTLAVAGIHLSAIPRLDYESHLFYEKDLRSVTANTRQDGRELLAAALTSGLHPQTTIYDLRDANQALLDLKRDRLRGTGVLRIHSPASAHPGSS